MADFLPKKKEIIGLVEAQAKLIDSITERLSGTERLVEKQETRNYGVIIGVLVGTGLVVASVAVSVIISNKADKQFYSGLEKDRYEQNLKVQDLSNKVDNLKIRNPYLK